MLSKALDFEMVCHVETHVDFSHMIILWALEPSSSSMK